MNYQEILKNLKNGHELVAIFPDGDEYPLRATSDYSVILTGGLDQLYFTEDNDGHPKGIKDVVLQEQSPFTLKKGKMEEYDIHSAISDGLIPEPFCNQLVGYGGTYTLNGHPVYLLVEWEVYDDDFVSLCVADKGALWLDHQSNPESLMGIKLLKKIHLSFNFYNEHWEHCTEEYFEFCTAG